MLASRRMIRPESAPNRLAGEETSLPAATTPWTDWSQRCAGPVSAQTRLRPAPNRRLVHHLLSRSLSPAPGARAPASNNCWTICTADGFATALMELAEDEMDSDGDELTLVDLSSTDTPA